jgi:hypothetical protein
MKLFLISLASKEHSVMPQCAKDALTCANRFSGCDVIALTDMPTEGWQDATPYMGSANAYKEDVLRGLTVPLNRFFPMSARYFIMEEYIGKHGISEPVFNCDWDILVFSNLPEHFKAVGGLETDLCSCLIRSNKIAQAPMLISNLAAIKSYTELMRGYLAHNNNNQIFFCDITQWTAVRKKGGFSDSFSCATLRRDTYFDPSTGMDNDVFDFIGSSKRIAWKDGLPHFIEKDTNNIVRAIAIHTFMGWRNRTQEIMKNLTT